MPNNGIISGSLIDSVDWKLPAIATASGSGTNAVTSSTFAVLPTTTCSTTMTNPHPEARLLVMAEYGAWLSGNTSTDVRGCLNVSGSLVVTPGIGGDGPVGWGEIIYSAALAYDQQHCMCTYILPISAVAATFAVHAMRTGVNATKFDYPTLRIIPLRYLP